LKSAIAIAKNYLSGQHIKKLNRIVSAYLDLAENWAEPLIPMTMTDWATFRTGRACFGPQADPAI
jgi:hypothetical protein